MDAALKLLNYLAAGMIIIPVVVLMLTLMDYLDKSVLHNPIGWAPMLAGTTLASCVVFYLTHERKTNDQG